MTLIIAASGKPYEVPEDVASTLLQYKRRQAELENALREVLGFDDGTDNHDLYRAVRKALHIEKP